MKKEKLLQAFKMFDIDGSGKISSAELRKCLGRIIVNILENEIYSNSEQSIWDNLIKDADQNGDGEIDYLEFVEMMENLEIK